MKSLLPADRRRASPRIRRRLLALALLQLALLGGCDSGGLNPGDYGAWSFTGYVVDGSTKDPLVGASIEYSDKDGALSKASTDDNGAFIIQGIPFGDHNFKFTYRSDSGGVKYTSRMAVISDLNESRSVEGVVGSVSMVVALYPLTGSLKGTLSAKLPGSSRIIPAASVGVKLSYTDTSLANSSPIVFDASTDSLGRFSFSGAPLAPGASLIFNSPRIDGLTYALAPVTVGDLFSRKQVDLGALYLAAKDSSNLQDEVRSNVLSSDGFGLTNIPVDRTLFYVLPSAPKEGSVTVTLSGGIVPNTRVEIRGDTLFIDPLANLSYDTQVTVGIEGLDTAGSQFHFVFDGVKQFRTEKGIYALRSNAWGPDRVPFGEFDPNDTLWVEFSAPLDSDAANILWFPSTADNTISAKGAGSNAYAWVHEDTLFVLPDQRLAVDYGETMGFKISVLSRDGKRSDSVEVTAKVISDNYYVRWTNTKDFLGNMRTDFGPSDSVVVVSNSPIAEIRGLSAATGKTAPPDLFLDNVRLSGDTIVYRPSLYLKADSVYGIDFDILFKDGNFRRDVLPVSWKTASTLQLLSVDNRKDGLFRPMAAIGDSFTVVFSAAIDTSESAPVPFKVLMRDVNGESVRSSVRWLSDRRTAVIHNVDTLPTADFDASPAYSDDAVETRAVASVSFDLSTIKGERIFGFKPEGSEIELHTEKGLCVVDASILVSHDHRLAVERSETPRVNFERNASIGLSFSRALDTAAIRADTANSLIVLATSTDTVKTDLEFSSDAKTATLKPKAILAAETEYRVLIRDLPAQGISGAAPINKHGGTFTATALNNSLLDAAFRTKP